MTHPPHFYSAVTSTEGCHFDAAIGNEADDPISRSLAQGELEACPLRDLMFQLFRPGLCFLDLGAHIGSFSLAAAAAGCEVAAVEASPRNAALIQASIARNRFEKLRLVQAAVSDRAGTLDFCQAGPYGHVQTSLFGSIPSIAVRALTVDELLVEVGWDRVDLIKMDVEGSEVRALRGMTGLLARADAPTVLFEGNGHMLHRNGQTVNHLKAALEEFGYRCYRIEAGRLRVSHASELQPEVIVDYLAAKQLAGPLSGWRVEPQASRGLRVEWVLAACGHPNEDCRAHVARVLETAPDWLFSEPEVRQALARLRSDPHEEVRSAAGWSAQRRVKLTVKQHVVYGLRRFCTYPLRAAYQKIKGRLVR
jgi:FkbM family methyltransferase